MFAGGQCCLWRTEVSIRWSGVDLLLEGPSTPWHIDNLGPPLQGATGEARVGGASACSRGANSGLHPVGGGQDHCGAARSLLCRVWARLCVHGARRHAGSFCLPVKFVWTCDCLKRQTL